MRKANYKVSQLLSNKKETEKSINLYFKEQGYQVFYNYASKIKNGKIASNDNIRSLFRAYDSGYPDLLLRKDKILSFVEIKLDGDNLRPNQVLFLDKLAEEEDVLVLYVNNINKDLDGIRFETPSNDIIRVDIRKRMKSLKKLERKNNYRPFWKISRLYHVYGDKLLEREILVEIASVTKIEAKKIEWFINKLKTEEIKNDNLEPEEIENKVEEYKTSKRLENIRKRKERILFKHNIITFPEWAEELTVKELLEKLKTIKAS